ncbi:hypothetical protein ACWEO4_41645 [Streptomyces sp. NPDC004393]|uniref:hypothetical protein n=1 Tax=Streptomyces sp. NPDC004533 TaxID=3154278 RepID=UPI0033A49109
MDTETFMSLTSPAVTSAVTAYGAAVLTRAEGAAADATVGLGQRIISAVWRRRSPEQQAELETTLDYAARPGGEDAMGALRYQIRLALNSDPQLLADLAAQLPQAAPTAPRVEASGTGAIAVGGDNHGALTTNVTTTPAPVTPTTPSPAGSE